MAKRKKRTKKKRKSASNLDSKIRSALRKIWRYGARDYKARAQALAGQKRGENYECETCKKTTKKPQVDHKEPVVCPRNGHTTWQTYIERLFVPSTGLNVLCETCHKKETKEQDAIRKKYKTGRYAKKKKS